MSERTRNIYLNGQFMPLEEARIPVLDRGFLFADSVYEVIPAYGGHLLRLEQHIQRLESSLQAIRMENPLPLQQWRSILEQLLEQHPDRDQSIYIQVTRGAAAGRDHAIPDDLEPTVLAMASPIPAVDPQQAVVGIKAVSLEDIRWHQCNIKATALLANVLLKQQAADEDAAEAILIRDGMATEGSASNLFIVSDGLLITPPTSRFLLPGITRDLVLELAKSSDINCEEREIDELELESADEIWLTSSTKEIMPVTSLNDRPVGDGIPGPLFQRLSGIYSEMRERIREGGDEGIEQQESIMQFPCSFTIKAMGLATPEFTAIVEEIVSHHAPEIDEDAVTTRPSREGKYSSVSITIEATSRQQLDAIYQELSEHKQVLMSL